ncbi:MAG TPA: hypothetical protein VK797_25875 [Tepidisphaeraceae bacterium]|jgi:hypothetical protein|nr:hypothetical protein [Tepidisphaeraceae bacterium]
MMTDAPIEFPHSNAHTRVRQERLLSVGRSNWLDTFAKPLVFFHAAGTDGVWQTATRYRIP